MTNASALSPSSTASAISTTRSQPTACPSAPPPTPSLARSERRTSSAVRTSRDTDHQPQWSGAAGSPFRRDQVFRPRHRRRLGSNISLSRNPLRHPDELRAPGPGHVSGAIRPEYVERPVFGSRIPDRACLVLTRAAIERLPVIIPDVCCRIVTEKRQKSIATSACHLGRHVEQGVVEDDRATDRRVEASGPIFRKAHLAAVEIIVGINRHGKAQMCLQLSCLDAPFDARTFYR